MSIITCIDKAIAVSKTDVPTGIVGEDLMKSIKNCVRTNNTGDNCEAAVSYLVQCLRSRKNRISALKVLFIMDQLFNRSHEFRCCIVDKLANIAFLCGIDLKIEHVSNVNKKRKLTSTSKKSDPNEDLTLCMREGAICYIKQWNTVYGDHYPGIRVFMRYLYEACQIVDCKANEVSCLLR